MEPFFLALVAFSTGAEPISFNLVEGILRNIHLKIVKFVPVVQEEIILFFFSCAILVEGIIRKISVK